MAQYKDPALVKATFDTLCRTLEQNNWPYRKDEQTCSIRCSVQGEEQPITLNIRVDADRMLVLLASQLLVTVSQDKRLDVVLAVCGINNLLVDGCFDYDYTTGKIYFRMTNSFVESRRNEEFFDCLVRCAAQTVDAYSEQLQMISSGMLSIADFLTALQN